MTYTVNPLHVGMGLIPSWSIIDKFGKNEDVDTVFIPVSHGGVMLNLTTAETLTIVSDDAADTLAGAGAQQLEIQGLDAAGELQVVVYDMAGTTPVITTETWLTYFRLQTLGMGSTGDDSNVGTITVSATVTTAVTTFILPAEGQSQIAQYTIPVGFEGFLHGVFISTDSSNIITGHLQVKPPNETWKTKFPVKLSAGQVPHDMSGSGALVAGTRIRWMAKANQPNNEVDAGFKVFLKVI